jgi:lipopolysaccharide/colanic/teichoic acid biosynthesis glycosyltransferase
MPCIYSYEATKRAFDIFFGAIGLLVSSPLVITAIIAMKLTSRGPIFYRGVRTGLYGRPFRILKLRTMLTNAEELGGPSTALNDPRLTPIGGFLRKYKLDELPQFLNIMLGDMSFVGPRPQVELYTKLYEGDEKLILTVRPGLTDYSTLKFINMDKVLGNDSVDEKYLMEVEPKKNLLRLKYVKERSHYVDIIILVKTVMQLLGVRKKWSTED